MKSATLRPFITVSLVIVLAIIFLAGVRVHASQTGAAATSSKATTEYHNDKFQFSLQYPSDMAVSETDGGDGGQIISFINATTGKQFEIDAFPYSQVDIAAGNFHPHDAYGTSDQGLFLQDVNFFPGDIPEFWFVKLGVKYGVTTINGDEAWLAGILKSWQFN